MASNLVCEQKVISDLGSRFHQPTCSRGWAPYVTA